MLTPEARAIVAAYDLAPHPEGGHYREIFRSPRTVTDVRGATRSALTVIYFLLGANEVSAWHRLQSDETWHYILGDELEIVTIDASGHAVTAVLGSGGPYVAAIPAGRPFAARLPGGNGFAFVSCTVAPGFDFADFELLDSESLSALYPEAHASIGHFAATRKRT